MRNMKNNTGKPRGKRMKTKWLRTIKRAPRLEGNSIPEVCHPYDEVATRICHRVDFRGHELRQNHVLNAIVLDFLDKTEEEQLRIVERGVRKLEDMLCETTAERAKLASIRGEPVAVAVRDVTSSDGQHEPTTKKKPKMKPKAKRKSV